MSRFLSNTFGCLVLLFVLYRHSFFSSFIFLPTSVAAYSTTRVRYPYFTTHYAYTRLFFSVLDYTQNLSFLFFCTRYILLNEDWNCFSTPAFFASSKAKSTRIPPVFSRSIPIVFAAVVFSYTACCILSIFLYPLFYLL